MLSLFDEDWGGFGGLRFAFSPPYRLLDPYRLLAFYLTSKPIKEYGK